MQDQKVNSRKADRMKRGGAALALLWLAPAGLLLAGWAAHDSRTIECTPTPRISLSNLTGKVVVRGWDKSQVRVEHIVFSPRVEVDTELLPPTGAADKIRLTTHVLDPLVNGSEQAADYTLDVPLGASLEIRNPQGSVQIEKLQADADVEAVGGRVAASDVSGHLAIRSVGGDIEIVRPSGRVEAYSITGSLHFVSAATAKLRASTTSGNILYEGDFLPGGDYMLSTYSGAMDIVSPPSASFELRAKTLRGKLENSLHLIPNRRSASPLYSGNSLLGTRNAGKATVELTSFSGAIRIRPQ